jgi:hypothetical protein
MQMPTFASLGFTCADMTENTLKTKERPTHVGGLGVRTSGLVLSCHCFHGQGMGKPGSTGSGFIHLDFGESLF